MNKKVKSVEDYCKMIDTPISGTVIMTNKKVWEALSKTPWWMVLIDLPVIFSSVYY